MAGGSIDYRGAGGESFGVMKFFGIQLEGVVTLIYAYVKTYVIRHQKKKKSGF